MCLLYHPKRKEKKKKCKIKRKIDKRKIKMLGPKCSITLDASTLDSGKRERSDDWTVMSH